MLLWLEDIGVTRADLLNATVPWHNAEDTFVVADTQKSDKSCLKVHTHPTFFITLPSAKNSIELHHTADDAERHIRAHLTTILGSLRCRSDVQLADGKALLLKYVSSYVTKMHESATSEGLYCNGVTGYQAANSFLRTVTPLEPQMIFELGSTKVCWTNKMTLLFRPHPIKRSFSSFSCSARDRKMISLSSSGCAPITPPPPSPKCMTDTDTW